VIPPLLIIIKSIREKSSFLTRKRNDLYRNETTLTNDLFIQLTIDGQQTKRKYLEKNSLLTLNQFNQLNSREN
jgi:hypothetical protein